MSLSNTSSPSVAAIGVEDLRTAPSDSPVTAAEVYRLLFEHATDAILAVDLEQMSIESANPRLLELTGFGAAEVVGHDVRLLFPPMDASDREGRAFSTDVLQRLGLHEEIRVRRADDFILFVSMAVGHVPKAGAPTAVCILRDATERRLLERELITKHMALRQANEELLRLSRDLEQRNQEIAAMYKRMSALSQQAATGAFTAGVAHGINNPLAAVVSSCRQMTKVVAELTPSPATERLRELLLRQQGASARIQTLISDMRRVHRQGAPSQQMADVDVRAELEGAIALFAHRLSQVEIVRRYGQTTPVPAYPDELQHLFCNLIDNALLAMEDRGRLILELEVAGNALRVAIEDDGPGLPDAVRSRLFEPFVTTRPGGTGLGLCAAHRLAERHRGSLTAESVVPKGTRFVLQMPLSPTPAQSDEVH